MADKHPAQPARPKKDDEALYGDVVFDPDPLAHCSPAMRADLDALSEQIKRWKSEAIADAERKK